MKEVVDEILAAEKKVEAALKEARDRAAEIRRKSENEAAAIIAEAQETAQSMLQQKVADARQKAEEQRREALEAAEAEKDSLREKSANGITALVDEISAMIFQTRFPEEHS